MGCDIHAVLEVKYEGKWVGLHSFPYLGGATHVWGGGERYNLYTSWNLTGRNYRRFSKLAGVRGDDDVKPLGIPDDASDLAVMAIDGWGSDGHSHSYLSFKEFAMRCVLAEFDGDEEKLAAFVAERLEGDEDRLDKMHRELFGMSLGEYSDVREAGESEYRVVFWFDN